MVHPAVTDGLTARTLEIVVRSGYRVQARGSKTWSSRSGSSHPVTIVPPEGITFRVGGSDQVRWSRAST